MDHLCRVHLRRSQSGHAPNSQTATCADGSAEHDTVHKVAIYGPLEAFTKWTCTQFPACSDTTALNKLLHSRLVPFIVFLFNLVVHLFGDPHRRRDRCLLATVEENVWIDVLLLLARGALNERHVRWFQ